MAGSTATNQSEAIFENGRSKAAILAEDPLRNANSRGSFTHRELIQHLIYGVDK